MKKIPTIFQRDWNGDKSRVLNAINPEAQWVFDGEGIATQKLDGTCCMIRDGWLFKRREVSFAEMTNKAIPSFDISEHDAKTGKVVGWVPVGDGPEDRWHNEALKTAKAEANPLSDGTYELIGPKVQGNPERATKHRLIAHNWRLTINATFHRTFKGIRAFLDGKDMEGIVFRHPDGRMAKIKGRDFGLRRRT